MGDRISKGYWDGARQWVLVVKVVNGPCSCSCAAGPRVKTRVRPRAKVLQEAMMSL